VGIKVSPDKDCSRRHGGFTPSAPSANLDAGQDGENIPHRYDPDDFAKLLSHIAESMTQFHVALQETTLPATNVPDGGGRGLGGRRENRRCRQATREPVEVTNATT
jgi:hypothetical protein